MLNCRTDNGILVTIIIQAIHVGQMQHKPSFLLAIFLVTYLLLPVVKEWLSIEFLSE